MRREKAVGEDCITTDLIKDGTDFIFRKRATLYIMSSKIDCTTELEKRHYYTDAQKARRGGP